MAESATITVAIPFYRGLSYLKEAVESVLAQRNSNWRLFVSDDGGIEAGVAELVSGYGDDRIEYCRNETNLGMVNNWNRCIDRADTDLVSLLHADDLLLPDYIEVMRELAERHRGAVAVCCNASIIDANGVSRFSTADAVKRFYVPRVGDPVVVAGEPGLRAMMAGNFIMCPTLCLRKEVLGDRRFSNDWKQVQDLEFTARLLIEGDSIVYTRRVAYAYRRHAAGATAVQSESMLRFEEEFALFDLVAERAAARGWSRAARVSAEKRIVRLHLAFRAMRELLRLKPARALALFRYRGGPSGEAH